MKKDNPPKLGAATFVPFCIALCVFYGELSCGRISPHQGNDQKTNQYHMNSICARQTIDKILWSSGSHTSTALFTSQTSSQNLWPEAAGIRHAGAECPPEARWWSEMKEVFKYKQWSFEEETVEYNVQKQCSWYTSRSIMTPGYDLN